MNNPAKLHCPICKSLAIKNKFNDLYDDRFGYPGKFELSECVQCQHLFLKGDFSPESLKDLYSNYYPRSNFKLEDYRPYQETHGIGSWLNGDKSSPFRWVPKNVRILDIGCGFGESLGYHQNRGCDAFGVEADENIRRVADKYGLKVHVGLFDQKIYQENFFDYVTLSQVIEHVTEPEGVLTGIAQILKKDGHVILSTPNAQGLGARLFGKTWIHWHTPYHLHFFSQQSFEMVSQKVNLKIESIKTTTPSMWAYLQLVHLLNYPRFTEPSDFWLGKKVQLLGWKKILFKIINVLYRFKFFHVYTRLVDMLGLGDNLVVIMRKN